ncbi:hypothetical protein [Mucilaginibacter mallensis]|uniref:hypothetical protein n=1 Tax=Mucilaginibacter mallensis TaxID=652787 RepID=UPI000B84011C|nr:hypothetical protein [Mucilaginibacter mallensis]
MVFEFLIKGSAKDPYKVTFQNNDGHVYAGCNCQSRKSGMACKHIFNILDGDVSEMVGNNHDDISNVLQICKGTRFMAIYTEYKNGLKLYNSKVLTDLRRSMVTKP